MLVEDGLADSTLFRGLHLEKVGERGILDCHAVVVTAFIVVRGGRRRRNLRGGWCGLRALLLTTSFFTFLASFLETLLPRVGGLVLSLFSLFFQFRLSSLGRLSFLLCAIDCFLEIVLDFPHELHVI